MNRLFRRRDDEQDVSMVVIESDYLLPGQVALKHRGKIVWVGPISAPWEDVDCDAIVVSKRDYDAIKMRTLPEGSRF